jgi:phage baseplate assembly protein W
VADVTEPTRAVDRPSFLGRGWSFPPAFDRAVLGVRMLEQEIDIASSLHILLSTAQGERIMVPQYGCNMDELVFENLDTRMRTLMADKIESAILYHEPRIDLDRVEVFDDPAAGLEGHVLIGVTYRVRTTNSRFNFVFPYYRDEGTDINLTTAVRLLPDEAP